MTDVEQAPGHVPGDERGPGTGEPMLRAAVPPAWWHGGGHAPAGGVLAPSASPGQWQAPVVTRRDARSAGDGPVRTAAGLGVCAVPVAEEPVNLGRPGGLPAEGDGEREGEPQTRRRRRGLLAALWGWYAGDPINETPEPIPAWLAGPLLRAVEASQPEGDTSGCASCEPAVPAGGAQ